MLSSVSWQQYFTFLLIALFLYYLFVWVVYFKAKLPVFSGMGRTAGFSLHGEDQPDEVMQTAQHVIEELRPVFTHKQNKNELILALQQQLKRYQEWDKPGFRETINGFIVSESLSICSIRLDEESLRAVWLQA